MDLETPVVKERKKPGRVPKEKPEKVPKPRGRPKTKGVVIEPTIQSEPAIYS